MLPVHLGSDEREAHLEALAKQTISAFVHYQRIQFPSGSFYHGDVVHGKIHGFGKEESPAGDVFLGHWVNGCKQGLGTVRYGNGDKYEGSWEANSRHGTGRYTWPSGRSFEGMWYQGKRQGPGSILFTDKSKFEGIWIDDKPEARGKITSENGDTFCGSIRFISHNNTPLYPIDYVVHSFGEGEAHYADGSRYVGTFANDQRNGYGVFVFPDGERYQGMWKDNKRHGYGLFQYTDGTVFEGMWSNDSRKGMGRLFLANGDIFTGSWRGDQISQATFTKGNIIQAPKSSRQLLEVAIKASKDMGQDELSVYTQKWRGFSESEATFGKQWPVSSKSEIISLIRDGNHPLGQAVAKFTELFEVLYGNFMKQDVAGLIPKAVDDISSFIAYEHKRLASRIRWDPPLTTKDGTKLLIVALKDIVFSRVYPCLFSLYRAKNFKKDTLFKTKLDSLKYVTPSDLGIHIEWERGCENEVLKAPPGKGFHLSHRVSSSFSTPLKIPSAKQNPFLASIRSLHTISDEYTVQGKLKCLMETSKHIIMGCSPQKGQYRQDLPKVSGRGQDSLTYIGAEEKFPIFVFVVLKSNASDLHAHINFLSDFLSQQTITKTEGGYRLTELKAALQFIMKLYPNLYNHKGELVPLSTIKNDLKVALAVAQQKQIAHHRANIVTEQNGSHGNDSYSGPTTLNHCSLRSHKQRTKSEPPNELGLKLGFLVGHLKVVARRQDGNFYAPALIDEEHQRVIAKNQFSFELVQLVLNSIGMRIECSPRAPGDKAKETSGQDSPRHNAQDSMIIVFERKLPLWVYDHLADTLALYLPS